jgi:hypothetical protein
MDSTSLIIIATTLVLSALALGIIYVGMLCLNKEVDKSNR